MGLSHQVWFRAPAPARSRPSHREHVDASSRAAFVVWVPVAVVGAAGLAFAAGWLASANITWSDGVGIALLIAAATLAEAFPVPIEGVAVGSTSLATIFLVAGATIYGWAAAAVAGFLAMALVELGRRRPFSRIAFNSGVYVLAGIAAGGAAAGLHNGTLLGLALGAVAAAVAFYLVDITLLAAVVTRSRGIAFPPAFRSYVQLTFVPFAVMASLAVILVVLWDRSPFITRVEPLPLAADVVDATRTHLPHGLSLELLHDPTPPDVAADPDKLRQVLVNLVENAVKYSDEGRIEVRLQRLNGKVRFSVRDEGPGIPPSQRERVFEKFYRLDPT